jgi:hypothetical protein
MPACFGTYLWSAYTYGMPMGRLRPRPTTPGPACCQFREVTPALGPTTGVHVIAMSELHPYKKGGVHVGTHTRTGLGALGTSPLTTTVLY